MAAIPATLFFSCLISLTIPLSLSSSIVEELNQPLPPDFHVTLLKNCIHNPSLPYCSASSADLPNVFKSTIVARHLCNESNNPNCTHSFTKIDLRSRPIIAPLYLSFNFFWEYCPPTISTIDLSNNSLKGAFPNDILYCTAPKSRLSTSAATNSWEVFLCGVWLTSPASHSSISLTTASPRVISQSPNSSNVSILQALFILVSSQMTTNPIWGPSSR